MCISFSNLTKIKQSFRRCCLRQEFLNQILNVLGRKYLSYIKKYLLKNNYSLLDNYLWFKDEARTQVAWEVSLNYIAYYS